MVKELITKEEYNTIVRESESRGYIEAKEEKEFLKESFTAEIIGEGPFRVKKRKIIIPAIP